MWNGFEIYALLSLFFWTTGILLCIPKSKKITIFRDASIVLGILSLGTFIASLWYTLERPPLRTLGETRLWYSEITAIIAFLVYKRYKYSILAALPLLFSILFLLLNYLHPDIHNKALMPALQSYWFVPHVVAYLTSYSFLGITCAVGLIGVYKLRKKQDTNDIMIVLENIMYIGFGILTTGLIFGGLWAKEAWGHYWTWDPKETWAFLTWGTYLVYIHLHINKPNNHKLHLYYVSISFIVLLVCWFGLSYLPAAQTSVHVYSN